MEFIYFYNLCYKIYNESMMLLKGYNVNPALIVIDVQNGFASTGGSYHNMDINISNYRRAVPKIYI